MLWWHVREVRTNRGVNLDAEIRQLLTGNPFPIDEEERAECLVVEQHGVKILLESAGLMILGGVSAGLIGIGGSLIYNPFLLALGLHPQVVASTATLLIFFSSSVVATSFYFHHILNVSYAAHFVPPSIIAGFIGVLFISRVVKATGRASIVIILLAVLITLGAVITGTFETFRSYTAFQEGAGIGFQPFCD